MKKIVRNLLILFVICSCEREERIEPRNIFNENTVESSAPLDLFLKREFRDPYGSVIIYKFVDKFIDRDVFATPPQVELVKPVAELIKQAWITPYNVGADNGESFMNRYFPAEIVLLGSPIFNGDGTITLGIADSGVRVTLTQVNEYTPGNTAWIQRAFRTLHHEFAHIVDQNFNFDDQSFFEISGSDYTSPGSWTQETISTAIERGMVTPYGTSAVGEDFAELVSYIITTPPDQFLATYITPERCPAGDQSCARRNIGRQRILQKYNRIVEYYTNDVGVNILMVRDEFLKSLN